MINKQEKKVEIVGALLNVFLSLGVVILWSAIILVFIKTNQEIFKQSIFWGIGSIIGYIAISIKLISTRWV